jgi:hypothetical protein
MIRMPGAADVGPLPVITAAQQTLSEQLRAHVTALSVDIGERHHERSAALRQAADYVSSSSQKAGLAPRRLAFEADGMAFKNIEATVKGSHGDEVVIVGAHYDSAYGTPAAKDNGSGVAAMLALAKAFALSGFMPTIAHKRHDVNSRFVPKRAIMGTILPRWLVPWWGASCIGVVGVLIHPIGPLQVTLLLA